MWGYEDDAPVAGQPFYDIVELYGDFKRATNDFSDYLEKEINDWAKGLDEDYKNRELAKPASMRSDFGDAITGLTSGKEDNLSFGGKAGAFLRGLLVDGCGKLLIKDTLLAASSPCDTAKSVMETVKLVGDMDEEDFSKIAKEIKTTWDEASEEEKLNYSGQAGAIVADFLIAKKLKLPKQAKVVETGVKASSKVDNLLEAGVKTGSKVDDIAEAGAKASSKTNDTAKTAGQTTARTVVRGKSGVNGSSSVDISGEVSEPNIGKVKDTKVEGNVVSQTQVNLGKTISSNILYDKVIDFAQKKIKELTNISKRQRDRFNTVCVAYDSVTGNFYYGRNKGINIEKTSKNSILFGDKVKDGILPKESLNQYEIGNCAEVDAINQALNDGAKLENISITTIHTTDNKFGELKPACENCTYTFKDKIFENYSGWIEGEK